MYEIVFSSLTKLNFLSPMLHHLKQRMIHQIHWQGLTHQETIHDTPIPIFCDVLDAERRNRKHPTRRMLGKHTMRSHEDGGETIRIVSE